MAIPDPLIQRLRLVNFRAFRAFTVNFGAGAYLIGPNNAGKSTILTALRVADAMLRSAYSRKPSVAAQDGDRRVVAYPIPMSDFPMLAESLAHEFTPVEVRLELTWTTGSRLTAVWPNEEGGGRGEGFFYLEKKAGMVITATDAARATFPALGVIPVLGPVDHEEELLTDTYVKRNIAGRLASRHFRNQLRLLARNDEFGDFCKFADSWLTDITLDDVRGHANGRLLDVYYSEKGGRSPRELTWAGDGLQVWLQLLYHVHRLNQAKTLILDEPEVYLHADLQRRLVQLLASTGKQIVLATHSSEIVAEIPASDVVLIDKSQRRAVRAPDDGVLQELSATLGTQFNLRLAKAMRSRVALFVEGGDLAVVRKVCEALGCSRLVREDGVAVIPLGGYSRWTGVEPFRWLVEKLLPGAITVFVLLDRDYRPLAVAKQLEEDLKAVGVSAHVWKRKEIESYLLVPAALARAAGVAAADLIELLSAVTDEFESDVFARVLDEEVKLRLGPKAHRVTITKDVKDEFDREWADLEHRLSICPAKDLLAALNSRLPEIAGQPLSFGRIARHMHVSDIPVELATVLRRVEAALG